MSKIHNFSAGPCILPQEVFQEASEAVLNFNNSGLSILEMSHRSAAFVDVMEEARSLVKEVLNVPSGYEVLFLQGGASTGFLIAAYNYLSLSGVGKYVNTGAWSGKALKEAKRLGGMEVIASSEDQNFSYIPDYENPSDGDYLHLTSNNTIFGTQFQEIKGANIPLICDMSSDIFSKEVNVGQYDLIYAGAQKNLGPAGATVYIVKTDSLGKSGRDIPAMLDLNVHISKDSMFNTPPVFSIYVSMLTLRWMKKNGGMNWIADRNQRKSDLLYNEVERNPLFKGTARKQDRSKMNPTFVLNDESHTEAFNKLWNDANISGIKGHRSVGGYRASMYNAMDVDCVQVLVDCMKELENKA